jgi:uncharacterized protein YbdZ (MbtH family)
MAKYVRNDTGTLHSVDDDFTVPDGWEVVDESTARTEAPDLLGTPAPEAPVEEEETTE